MQRFDDYMAECLYGPDGFYTRRRGKAGRRGGDFITSPEVGPLFGTVIDRWLTEQWTLLGSPHDFTVVDVGAGPGALVRSLRSAGEQTWQFVEVDPAASVDLPEDLSGAVVIANEVLDNVPFRVVEGEAEWFVEGAAIVSAPIEGEPPHGVASSAGAPAPWVSGAHDLVATILSRGAEAVLMFDYGALTTSELADRGGWLRTYRGHERGHDPTFEPGLWDITTDVPVDQLPSPISVSTQAEFLRANGIVELVDEGRAYWHEHAAAPDVQTITMRSRIGEAEALLDPRGLGSWLCLEWKGGV